MDRKKAVEALLLKNILVTPELLLSLENMPSEDIEKLVEESKKPQQSIDIVFSYSEPPKKRECQDFVAYFNSRYNQIERILSSRSELYGATSISRLKMMIGRNISIIGIIMDKQITKNGNIILVVEDTTGSTKVLVPKSKEDTFRIANDCVFDEIIGITGMNNGEIIFANSVVLPDIPNLELKKSPEEGYAVFLSDIHVGSKKFLADDFNKFLKWISGEIGSDEQKEVAKKVKYVLIAGDVVDGVGIYPNQEDELAITDIYEQYNECARLLKKIPIDKKIIISPGNHDAMRISEPQPAFSGEMHKALLELPNLQAVSNPAYVTLDKMPGFAGIDVLIYHGYSFDYYVANVEGIRSSGGYDAGGKIMEFLLKRRHLSPAHSSTLYLPIDKDNLVISRVPDIFATGHIHRASASQYKHVTLINASCWQGKTSFQERMGHVPQPARVPIINLRTREVKILKFGEE